MRGAFIICAGVALWTNNAIAADQIRAVVHPASPLIERTVFGDSLNFDILITNTAETELNLDSVEISYLDASGGTLYERTLDYKGRAIETIPDRLMPPKTEKLIYNPFPVLPPDVDARQVRVRVTLGKPVGRGEPHEAALVGEGTATVSDAPSPRMAFPMKGRVLVWDAHDLHSHHRRWDFSQPGFRSFGITGNAGRYSYDFVLVDNENRMSTGEENENYFSFGAPIFAPRAGIVIEAEGGKADDKTFSIDDVKANPNKNFGNYVVIDHGDGLFSILGHFKENTLKVGVGDRVVAGQHIANAGASGSSLFPHLHYQLMDGPSIATAEGVPSYFKGLTRLRGTRRTPVRGVAIDSGDLVEAR